MRVLTTEIPVRASECSLGFEYSCGSSAAKYSCKSLQTRFDYCKACGTTVEVCEDFQGPF